MSESSSASTGTSSNASTPTVEDRLTALEATVKTLSASVETLQSNAAPSADNAEIENIQKTVAYLCGRLGVSPEKAAG